MYESFFELDRRPFSATPDPNCCVPGAGQFQEALDELVDCLESGQGIGILTAPAGLGKSLLCQKLASDISEKFATVLLGNSNFPTRRSLLQAILYELGYPYNRMGEQELRLELATAVKELHRAWDAMVLIVDEAHLLNERVLEEIRAITNLAEEGRPLVRVLLCGQLLLEENLASPAASALNQRICRQVALEPFTLQESAEYITHRLRWSGGEAGEIFTPDAIELVCQASDGSPRCLNQLCDHSLLLAYALERKPVSVDIVRDALEDLKLLPLHWNDPMSYDYATDSPQVSGNDQFVESTEESASTDHSLAPRCSVEDSPREDIQQIESPVEFDGSQESVEEVPPALHEQTPTEQAATASSDDSESSASDCEDTRADTEDELEMIEVGYDEAGSGDTAAEEAVAIETEEEPVGTIPEQCSEMTEPQPSEANATDFGEPSSVSDVTDSAEEAGQAEPAINSEDTESAATGEDAVVEIGAPVLAESEDRPEADLSNSPEPVAEFPTAAPCDEADHSTEQAEEPTDVQPTASQRDSEQDAIEQDTQETEMLGTDVLEPTTSETASDAVSETDSRFVEEIVYDRYAALDAGRDFPLKPELEWKLRTLNSENEGGSESLQPTSDVWALETGPEWEPAWEPRQNAKDYVEETVSGCTDISETCPPCPDHTIDQLIPLLESAADNPWWAEMETQMVVGSSNDALGEEEWLTGLEAEEPLPAATADEQENPSGSGELDEKAALQEESPRDEALAEADETDQVPAAPLKVTDDDSHALAAASDENNRSEGDEIEEEIGAETLDICLETQRELLERSNRATIRGLAAAQHHAAKPDGDSWREAFAHQSRYDIVQPEPDPETQPEMGPQSASVPLQSAHSQAARGPHRRHFSRLFSTLRRRQREKS